MKSLDIKILPGESEAMRETPTWDPGQYLRHTTHRTRPFHDLLNRITALPGGAAPRIADLGCGPGNVTLLLADRWPAARITGFDNSPQMLAAAAPSAGPTPAAASSTSGTPTRPAGPPRSAST